MSQMIQRLKGMLFPQSKDGWMVGSKFPISLKFGVRGRFDLKDQKIRNFILQQKDKEPLPPRITVHIIHPEEHGSALHQAAAGQPWIKNQFKHLLTFFNRQQPSTDASQRPRLD